MLAGPWMAGNLSKDYGVVPFGFQPPVAVQEFQIQPLSKIRVRRKSGRGVSLIFDLRYLTVARRMAGRAVGAS
jgi:hypothetical protein